VSRTPPGQMVVGVYREGGRSDFSGIASLRERRPGGLGYRACPAGRRAEWVTGSLRCGQLAKHGLAKTKETLMPAQFVKP